MNQGTDQELLSFAAQTLERQGAAVEVKPDRVIALLTQELKKQLQLPEEAVLGDEQAPLIYGSPLLDRLIALATRDVPVVYAQIEVPYLKKAGFEQLIGQDIVFLDGRLRISNRAEARSTYMSLVCHYLAMSDERKEGLIEVGINEVNGAFIPGLADRWQDFQTLFFAPGEVPPHFPVRIESALSAAMLTARSAAEKELADFFKSMERRLRRDVKSTREYYEALRSEMQSSLAHPHLTEQQQAERKAKIADLPAEMERKIVDLEQKYKVQVTLTARAALRFLIDVVQVFIELSYRKYQRSLRLIWNPVTRALDPLACENCGCTITRVHPHVVGSAIKLLCYACFQTGK
ncbi:hypothetical protein [Desulfoferrobacter suflitae]|uniref:hypothetical protein n=1 Tax=Desulfoferrobacter suflitae TaxID=2865782 RepID=UPI002164266D|nr:hypothetical protein [Desulfoferrobacter suflitae]MCK8601606.1 hypothetical protein [Desulfoferrobacter suflitae]